MRLAVFTSRYPCRTATFFERDMRSLAEAGVELDVFCIRPAEPELWQYSKGMDGLDNFSRAKVRHAPVFGTLRNAGRALAERPREHLSDAASVMWSAMRKGPLVAIKTASVLPLAWAWAAENKRYDHVLAYWGNYPGTCAWAFHRLQGRDVPFSIWLHAGIDLYSRSAYLREKVRYADNVLTCCEFNRDFIEKEFADEPDVLSRVHVSHHGLDLADYRFQPDNRRNRVVLAVGRLVANKGYQYLLWALHVLKARGVEVTLEFVGDGPEEGALRRLAQRLNVQHMITWRGWMNPADAGRAMAEATMLVHPSGGLGDGLPNVLREAMAVGTPVIASNVAGIPDALEDGCGVLVEPRDPAALALAIEQLLDAPERRRAIAEKARRRVEQRYDRRRTGQWLAGLLSSTRRRETAAESAPVALAG